MAQITQTKDGRMTREEQIIHAALEAGKQPMPIGKIWNSPLGRRAMSAYEIGFLDGAEWADAQPTDEVLKLRKMFESDPDAYKQGYEDAFDKACEFLKSYRQETPDGMGYIAGIVNDETIEDFRKYMEEQQ